MNTPSSSKTSLAEIEFSLNGTHVRARSGETILQAALRNGVEIPHLCYKPGYRADGNCRACMVEIDGERTLAASCCRYPSKEMQVRSDSKRAVHCPGKILEQRTVPLFVVHQRKSLCSSRTARRALTT